MLEVALEKDWDSLVEFYSLTTDYVPTLKKITLAQWILESRKDGDSSPGTSELAVEAVNFSGLKFNKRMETFGAQKYKYKSQTFCKFDNVEHFIDGYFYFIASGGYDRWHLLVDNPIDFISHLQDKGFAGNDDQYTKKVKTIYDKLEPQFKIDLKEIPAIKHSVSHGEFTYKIAQNYKVKPEEVFKLGRDNEIIYGKDLGTLYTGDLLYIITDKKQPTTSKNDPLADLKPCTRIKGDCSGRTHFVIHQSVAGNNTRSSVLRKYAGKRTKGHAWILKSGEPVFLWQFTEKNVRACKAEYPGNPKYKPKKGKFPSFPIHRKLIHIEIDYEEDGKPTSDQYKTLATLYIQSCKTVGRILTIVPHIEIDRGIRNGHNDPQNFDYNHFYSLFKDLGVDVSRIPKFEHDRYWAKTNYKIPFDTDTFRFPPILSGDPHKA